MAPVIVLTPCCMECITCYNHLIIAFTLEICWLADLKCALQQQQNCTHTMVTIVFVAHVVQWVPTAPAML